MKLNVCCGARLLSDYVNIDIVPTDGKEPNILADARKIPLEDGVASEIMCIHGFEHFYYWETADLLTEWNRLLQPGGLLVLEMPDLFKCCQNIASGFTLSGKHPDQSGMWGLYGDPREKNEFMSHKWGWTPKSLAARLKEFGFTNIREKSTEWHPVGRHQRDMRIEAVKA